jgi:hypothetical protein
MPRGNYDLMVLANAKDRIDAVQSTWGNTTLKSEIDRQIDESVVEQAGWNAVLGSLGYKPFPMWGEALGFNLTGTRSLSIDLVRMLAKINVSFANSTVASKLAVDQVILTNYNTLGYLVSRGWNWSATNVSQHTPDARTTPAGKGFGEGIIYPVSAADNINFANLVRDRIFLFEAAKPADPTNATQRLNSVNIIVRGYYDGSATPTYYRIDMVDGSSPLYPNSYFDIIRNHYYDIKITGINGPGYATGQEAFDNRPFNITTAINAWDERGMNNHTYDGRYQITVDFDNFTFGHTGQPQQPLKIYTDVPAGWTIEIPTANNWISVTPNTYNNSVVPFVSTTVQISCTPNDNAALGREGSFFIVAGNLRKEITVMQNGIWARSNVDASQPSGFAVNPADFGSYFQWNRRAAWNYNLQMWNTVTWGTGTWQTATWDSTTPGGTTWEAINDPCPAGWRLPTSTELQNLGTGTWTPNWNSTGVGGRVWGSGANQLFLPGGGWISGGGLNNVGGGAYWSSTPSGDMNAMYLRFSFSGADVVGFMRALGYSVRCVSE